MKVPRNIVAIYARKGVKIAKERKCRDLDVIMKKFKAKKKSRQKGGVLKCNFSQIKGI